MKYRFTMELKREGNENCTSFQAKNVKYVGGIPIEKRRKLIIIVF